MFYLYFLFTVEVLILPLGFVTEMASNKMLGFNL